MAGKALVFEREQLGLFRSLVRQERRRTEKKLGRFAVKPGQGPNAAAVAKQRIADRLEYLRETEAQLAREMREIECPPIVRTPEENTEVALQLTQARWLAVELWRRGLDCRKSIQEAIQNAAREFGSSLATPADRRSHKRIHDWPDKLRDDKRLT